MSETPEERPFLMQCVCGSDGEMTPYDGMYLRRYTPESHDGRGHALWTTDPDQAVPFASIMEAREAWMCVPITRPTRDDGKPNRPLTAYTIAIQRRQD